MEEDSDFWSDVGEIVTAVVVEATAYYAQQAVQNAINGGGKAASQSGQYALKQPIPPAICLVGDYARIAPAYAFYESTGNLIASVQASCDGRTDGTIGGIWLADDLVTLDEDGWVVDVNGGDGDGRYTDEKVKILFRDGLPTETAYGEIVTEFSDKWTEDHRGDATASVAMLCYAPKAKFQRQAFPNGRPELTLALRGVCYDWRDETQDRDNEATWKWSPNPVVWLVHLETQRWGVSWTRSVAPVLDALTAEADYCDELVATVAGSEPRYRLAGWFRDNEDEDKIRQKIQMTMDGYRSIDGRGHLVILAGRFIAPTVTLTAKDITGYSWQSGIETERRADILNVSFTSPAADYAQVECDPWVISEDGFQVEDFFVEWSPSFSQTRRLAKRAAARLRPLTSGGIETDVAGLKCWGQRYVAIQNDQDPDMADIVVEIPDGVEMASVNGFTFSAAQITAAIDAWNPATEEGADPGAPARNVYLPLAAPAIVSAVSFFDVITGSNFGVRLRIHATGPDRTDLTWFWRWRVTGSSAWSEGTDTDATGGDVVMETAFVPSDVTLDVQVAYSTTSLSPWSETTTVDTSLTALRLDFTSRLDSGYLVLLEDF